MVREFELRFAPWTTSSRNGGVATFQGQNGGGHARSGQSGQRELEFVVQCDCVHECGLVFGRIASQDRTEQVWPCLGPWRARVRRARRKQRRSSRGDWQQQEGGATWRVGKDQDRVSRRVCCSSRGGGRIARGVRVCVRARRTRRSGGVSAVGPINGDVIPL